MTIQVIGKKSGVKAEVETNSLAARGILRPNYQLRGAYCAGNSSSAASAIGFGNGAAAAGPLCIVKKFIVSAGVAASGSANIVTFTILFRRGSSQGAGGTTKLRTSFPDPVGALSPGQSGTADAQAIWKVTTSIPAVAGSKVFGPFDLLDLLPDRYLLVEPLHQFIVTASFTTAVTWSSAVYWEEYDLTGN